MNYKEKQINSECIYKGKIITLLKDDVILCDGNNAIREVVKHNGGVCVAALTENNEIMFVRQYRYPYDEEILELPAGKRNTVDEDPLVCGKRELREETGVTAKNFIPLGELYPTPGYCGEIIWMYAATDLSFGECEFDDDEFLSVERIPFDAAIKMVLNGEIKDAKTQTALLKLKIMRDLGKI